MNDTANLTEAPVSPERLDELISFHEAKASQCSYEPTHSRHIQWANDVRELKALREQYEWRPIATAPKYTELLVYRKDAGVMLGIYTSPDQFTPESHWDETAEALGDAFEAEDWFLFCWDGAERADGDLVPTHWMPLPMPPSSALSGQ